jgi:hypothetical protein
VSSPMTSSRSPILSLPESATIADDWPPCRRERAARRARPLRGSSAPAHGPTPRAPPLLDLPGARTAAWPPPPPLAGLERPRAAVAMPGCLTGHGLGAGQSRGWGQLGRRHWQVGPGCQRPPFYLFVFF